MTGGDLPTSADALVELLKSAGWDEGPTFPQKARMLCPCYNQEQGRRQHNVWIQLNQAAQDYVAMYVRIVKTTCLGRIDQGEA